MVMSLEGDKMRFITYPKTSNNYKICNGDFAEILPTIKDKSIDLILTDPPYNLGNFARTRNRHIHSMNRSNFVLDGWDNENEEKFFEMMDTFFALASQKLKIKGALLMFCSFFNIGTLVKLAEKYKFYYKTAGIWHKTNPMPRNMNLHFVNSNEVWLYFINNAKTGIFNNEGKLITDFIETSTISPTEKKTGNHPTQKPMEVMEFFIKLLSNKGDIVCDPFMGSGTTGVVAKALSRQFIGIELDVNYFETAQRRIEGV